MKLVEDWLFLVVIQLLCRPGLATICIIFYDLRTLLSIQAVQATPKKYKLGKQSDLCVPMFTINIAVQVQIIFI